MEFTKDENEVRKYLELKQTHESMLSQFCKVDNELDYFKKRTEELYKLLDKNLKKSLEKGKEIECLNTENKHLRKGLSLSNNMLAEKETVNKIENKFFKDEIETLKRQLIIAKMVEERNSKEIERQDKIIHKLLK